MCPPPHTPKKSPPTISPRPWGGRPEGLALPVPRSPAAIVPSALLPASPGRRRGGGAPNVHPVCVCVCAVWRVPPPPLKPLPVSPPKKPTPFPHHHPKPPRECRFALRFGRRSSGHAASGSPRPRLHGRPRLPVRDTSCPGLEGLGGLGTLLGIPKIRGRGASRRRFVRPRDGDTWLLPRRFGRARAPSLRFIPHPRSRFGV